LRIIPSSNPFRLILLPAVLPLTPQVLYSAQDPGRPNVILIMTDDPDYGDIVARGHPHLPSSQPAR